MREAREIVEAAARLRAERTPFVVATVVRVIGSSYRKPGARLIVAGDRRVAGSVSGGCLERDLVRSGAWRARNGPVVVRYDSSDPHDSDAALGCGGIVDVLLERVERADLERGSDPIAVMQRLLEHGGSAIATVFESTLPEVPIGARFDPRSASDDPLARTISDACRRAAASGGPAAPRRFEDARGSVEALVEPVVPPPCLVVFGAGFDAIPVVASAVRLGFRVTVWDPLARPDTRTRFAGVSVILGGPASRLRAVVDAASPSLALVMTHDRRHDGDAMAVLLGSRADYIGILGPRDRTERLASELALPLLDDLRVHAPVGLDLGAETPEEIALAIMAEALSFVRRATGSALRDRTRRAMHDAAAE